MAQTRIFRGVARRIYTQPNCTEYWYHDTAIAIVYKDGSVKLTSGGWRTATTKTAINQAGNQSGLGFGVYQKDYEWYATYRGVPYPFKDGMVLN